MTNFYTYLISSLPMLHFGAKPPFSYERFLKMCKGLASEKDVELLHFVGAGDVETRLIASLQKNDTLERWHAFDTALRNELVKIRASHKHIDPAKYMRKDGYAEMSISHIAMNAHRNPSMLEAEKTLDADRWRFLDELSFGHYFDIDILIIYALKLLILGRWEKINTTDKAKILEEVLV